MMQRLARPASRQSGQAAVEFLVAATLATSVLLLGIVLLGKFDDIRHRTLMGSRYAAWERTVWTPANASPGNDWYARYGGGALQVTKSDAEIQREVLARVATRHGALIAGSDREAGPQTGDEQNGQPAALPPMWKDHAGESLLHDTRDVAIVTGEADLPTALDAYTTNSFGSMPVAGGGASFTATLDLPTHTLQAARMRTAAAHDNAAVQRLLPHLNGFTVDDTNVLLANTWLPEGAPRARSLFTDAVPAARASLVAPSLYQGLRQYAPEIDTLEFGRVREDIVPADRLSK